MSAQENIGVALAARTASYRCFQAMFGSEPALEVIASLAGGDFRAIMSVFAGLDEDLMARLDALQVVAEEAVSSREVLASLEGRYTRLFMGPGPVGAAPWESAYVAGEGILFQASTLDVRKVYVGQGLIPQSYPHVADDHLALELDFMRLLSQRIQDEMAGGKMEDVIASVETTRRFLDDHLLKWVPLFCAALSVSGQAAPYCEAALLLESFLRADRKALDDLEQGLRIAALEEAAMS